MVYWNMYWYSANLWSYLVHKSITLNVKALLLVLLTPLTTHDAPLQHNTQATHMWLTQTDLVKGEEEFTRDLPSTL